MDSDTTHATPLAIPNVTSGEMVPTGWFELVAAPSIEAVDDWNMLEEVEARIHAAASYIESFDPDEVAFEQAKRLIEKRRGDLLGPDPAIGRPPKVPTRGTFDVNASSSTVERWRRLARWWDILWPVVLGATRKQQISQSRLLKIIVEHTPAVAGDADDWITDDERIQLFNGRFQDKLEHIPDGSVDVVFTDPPYPAEDLYLYGDLAEWCSRKLGPRGVLLTYSGKIHLPQVMEHLGTHLKYGWLYELRMGGVNSRILSRNIRQAWKPIWLYHRKDVSFPRREPHPDLVLAGAAEKDEYEWQQTTQAAAWMLERWCPPDGLVVDPFLGVGTTGIAAKAAGHRFIGCELDTGRFEKAHERISDTD